MKIMRIKQQDGSLVDVPFGVSDASTEIAVHNSSTSSHADIREEISQLSSEKIDKIGITLGVHTDGLVYVFVDGLPVGNGVAFPNGGISGDVVGNVDSNNNIVLTGSLSDGTYTIKYEMADGNTVNVGTMVLDSNVYYSITKNFTNCSINNSATNVIEGESYSATITANSGYELKSVAVTMGGANVSVTNGVINIAYVTGDIVITAMAEEATVTPSYTNLLPLSVNADGSDYKGTNGEDGYKAGYKMSGSSGNESATTGAYCSGFIPVTYYDTVRIKNVVMSNTVSVNNLVFYDANKTRLMGYAGLAGSFTALVEVDGDIHWFKPSMWDHVQNCAFFRFSCGGITDETIVTVNEEIVSDEPSYTNLFVPSEAIINKRVSNSSELKDVAGHFVTAFIDISNKVPFTDTTKIYVKGANFNAASSGTNQTRIFTYKSIPDTPYSGAYSVVQGANITQIDEGNGVISVSNQALSFPYDVKYMVLTLKVSDSTLTTADLENIVITIDEPIVSDEPKYKNLLPLSVNADGTPYVGDNGEKGYRVGYRIKSSGDESASSGAYCTGFMPVSATSYDDYIYVKNFTLSTNELNNAIALYDTSKNKLFQSAFGTTGYAWVTVENDVLKFRTLNMATIASQAAFFRFSCGGITDETIVTVNEKIE